jgi:hypothetical protein
MRQRFVWAGLIIGVGALVLAGLHLGVGQLAPTTNLQRHAAADAPARSPARGQQESDAEGRIYVGVQNEVPPHAAVSAPPRSPAPEERESESDNYVYFGADNEVVLERDKLKLTQVWEDGTTQYRYDDEMVVTVLANGEVLLLPDEI